MVCRVTQLANYALKVERDVCFLLEGGWRGPGAGEYRRLWIESVRTDADAVSRVNPYASSACSIIAFK